MAQPTCHWDCPKQWLEWIAYLSARSFVCPRSSISHLVAFRCRYKPQLSRLPLFPFGAGTQDQFGCYATFGVGAACLAPRAPLGGFQRLICSPKSEPVRVRK